MDPETRDPLADVVKKALDDALDAMPDRRVPLTGGRVVPFRGVSTDVLSVKVAVAVRAHFTRTLAGHLARMEALQLEQQQCTCDDEHWEQPPTS